MLKELLVVPTLHGALVCLAQAGPPFSEPRGSGLHGATWAQAPGPLPASAGLQIHYLQHRASLIRLGLLWWYVLLVTCCLRRSFTSPSSWFSCDICPKNCRLKSPVGTAEDKAHSVSDSYFYSDSKTNDFPETIKTKNLRYRNLV